jgi:histone H3/H4
MYRLIRELTYNLIETLHQEFKEANEENRREGIFTDEKFGIDPDKVRYTSQSLEILHESSEFFLVNLFEDSNLVSMVAKRQTLMPIDIKLVRYLRRHKRDDSTATDSVDLIKQQIINATDKIKKKK